MNDRTEIDALEDELAGLDDADAAGLKRLVARIGDAVAGVSGSVRDSVELYAQAARAEENVVLARTALEGTEPGDGAAARFHLRRALQLLRDLDSLVLEDTRELDRARNREEFLNG